MKNRTSHVLGALLGAVAMIGSTVLVAPSASAWEPTGGAVFNNPTGNQAARWRIVDTIVRSIKNARPGSRLMFSTFLMDSRAGADALVAARRRGVQVQIVMDGDDARTGQARKIARAVNKDNRPRRTGVDKDGVPLRWGKDKSFVVFCEGSCRGPGGANLHAKFYAFSRTGSARDVVMVSSSNLNAGGAVRGWNDLYVMKDRPVLYKQYAKIHAEMAQDTSQDRDGYREQVAGAVTSRFYPRLKGTDPVLQDLAKVRCRGANGGAGRNGHTAINISMFAWNSDRGMKIARRLVELDRNGCDVSIVYGAPSAKIRDYLADSARRGGVKLWDSRYDRDEDGLFDLRVHHKYMLINGVYGGDRSAWRVHTGSQNWGKGTLRRGDDNTINIVGRGAYRQYIRDWDKVTQSIFTRRVGVPDLTTPTNLLANLRF